MDILKYLRPDNQIAYGIVVFLIILFLVWAAWLMRWLLWLRHQRTLMRRAADVTLLVEALRERGSAHANPGDAPPASSLVTAGGPDAAFAEFCKVNSLKEQSPVTRHLRTIFGAGWNDGRLDVDALLKHTTGQIFAANSFLRSILSTFIVVGVLGTLFGLADSLGQLRPELLSGTADQGKLLDGLKLLIGELQSAFAPSIWGVGFTILGVLLFNAYLQFGGGLLVKTLEEMTLSVWVPLLYPNTSQRLLDTLQLSERQMQKSFAAAKKVAALAEEIQGETSGFNQALKNAGNVFNLLSGSSADLRSFAADFVKGVNSLVPFQQEIHQLYKQMSGDSRDFHVTLRESNARAELLQDSILQMLKGQSTQLGEALGGLKSYEKAYLTQREQIDTKLQEVLDAARRAFGDLAERNREVVEGVGTPLRQELVAQLKEVENTLRVQLKSIQDRFAQFDAPIKNAAEQIEGALASVVRRTEVLTLDMNRKFLEQNQTNQTQLQHLSDVNRQIPQLLTQLAAASKFQGEQVQVLREAMNGLMKDVAALDQSIGGLTQTVNLPKQDGQEVGAVQAGRLLLHLFRDGQEHGAQMKVISDEIYSLRREILTKMAQLSQGGRAGGFGDFREPGQGGSGTRTTHNFSPRQTPLPPVAKPKLQTSDASEWQTAPAVTQKGELLTPAPAADDGDTGHGSSAGGNRHQDVQREPRSPTGPVLFRDYEAEASPPDGRFKRLLNAVRNKIY